MFDINISNNMGYIQLSINFLNSVKGVSTIGIESVRYTERLKSVDPEVLDTELNTDSKRLAFWMNIYNANVQMLLRQNPELYKRKRSFFSKKTMWVAGEKISLDLIEHGILRRSKFKYSLGYLNNFFSSVFERKFRVNKIDYRIHFALNCGAKSCPAIFAYDSDTINEQMNVAASDYLSNEVYFNVVLNHAEIPALFLWFRNDFGGKNGIMKVLKQYDIIPKELDLPLKYKKYDWSLYLNNFK